VDPGGPPAPPRAPFAVSLEGVRARYAGCPAGSASGARGRALLVHAPVLVLDEPTAHLDPGIARELIEDVAAATGDRSVLLITHRPKGLELVDAIVELASTGPSTAP